jgi:hypothetical protein
MAKQERSSLTQDEKNRAKLLRASKQLLRIHDEIRKGYTSGNLSLEVYTELRSSTLHCVSPAIMVVRESPGGPAWLARHGFSS